MACFDVVLKTRGSLHACGDPTSYIADYSGSIVCTRERDGRTFRVGTVRAYRILAEQAQNNGQSIFEACDSYSQQLHDVYAAVYDPAEDELDPLVRDCFDCCSSVVLVLDYVVLAPRWRRLKLGLLAVRKMIDLLGAGCGLTVARFQPLHPESDLFLDVPADWVPRHRTAEDRRNAARKLRRYFRRMGFRRIPGTRFHGLSMTRQQPTLADLLQPST
jgi:hypothetical protein